MLELADAPAVTLTEREFARLMLDRWDWREEFDDRMQGYRRKFGDSSRGRQQR